MPHPYRGAQDPTFSNLAGSGYKPDPETLDMDGFKPRKDPRALNLAGSSSLTIPLTDQG